MPLASALILHRPLRGQLLTVQAEGAVPMVNDGGSDSEEDHVDDDEGM